MDIYVSTKGNDNWSGLLPDPNNIGTDGPVATIERARNIIREMKYSGKFDGPANVWLRGGRYAVEKPITFKPEDSAPVCYKAYPGEQPIIHGGKRITEWSIDTVAGSSKCWIADIPEVREGKWYFRQLFVNGQRRQRAKYPKSGFYRMESVPGLNSDPWHNYRDGQDAFVATEGDFKKWKNISDIELVTFHKWIEERIPIKSYDETSRLVILSRKSAMALNDDFEGKYPRYYIENIYEALSEPGEWYLDCSLGKLYYIPFPDEEPDNTEVFAPYTTQLIKIEGCMFSEKYVEFINFEDLIFEYADWNLDNGPSVQAAHTVPGVISMEGARFCAIKNCIIRHAGFYGVEIANGCIGNKITGNEIFDMGAGGIKVGGSDAEGYRTRLTGNNIITDNHIYSAGKIFYSSCGILSMHSFGNDISHNHIHDLYYSGISCGWVWGYKESVSKNNRIEKNYIHDIGHGLLSDMGGIYLLGVQPGTVVRGNVVHDIEKYCYGGWGIYTDEGSSHILIENNICYRTGSQCFHQHYGRENIVRNNVFAFGREGNVALSRMEDHLSFTLERNIFITDGPLVFLSSSVKNFKNNMSIISDLNLFWSVSGNINAAGGWGNLSIESGMSAENTVDMDEWKRMGHDTHSVYADPKFTDITNFIFVLEPDSQAFSLGFRQIDVSDVGPRV